MAMVAAPTRRVVHLLASSGFYGAERVVANLIAASTDTPSEVYCLCRNAQQVERFADEITRSGAHFTVAPFPLRAALHHLCAHLGSADCILHAHGYKETVLACLVQLFSRHQQSGLAVLVTQHGFTARNLKSRLYNLINLALCRWRPVFRIICVSSPILEIYQRFGIARQRLALIPNGTRLVPLQPRQAARNLLAQRWNLDANIPWIGFAGRFSAEKNPMLFVEICRAFGSYDNPLAGIMAGGGPLEADIQAAIPTLPAGIQVHLPGFIDEMDTFLAALDCLVVPSLTEGTPMVVLEAMWQRTPVIAAQVGGLPDMIESGLNGFLVEGHHPQDYARLLAKLLSMSGQDLQLLIDSAVDRVARSFSIEAQAHAYHDLYQSALQA